MGWELSRSHTVAHETFEEADAKLGWSLSELCFNGPEEELKRTENTQLAILTCSVAALRTVQEHGLAPDAVAGHSLGEYSALVAAGVLSFADALALVRYRAQFMAAASRKADGAMAAILGLEADTLRPLCANAQTVGIVEIANYNCPGQLIVSGETKAVAQVIESAKAAGATRCLPLSVSGAFHSPLMAPAREEFQHVIGQFPFHSPHVQVVANVTGGVVSEPDEIRRLLVEQVTAPVQWEQSVRTIGDWGVSCFVELGPGRALSGMVRRILPESTCVNVEDNQSLEKAIHQKEQL